MKRTTTVSGTNSMSNEDFAKFIVETPLYYRVKAVDNIDLRQSKYCDIIDYCDKRFVFKCPAEKSAQTFKTMPFEGYSDSRLFYRSLEDHSLPDGYNENTKLFARTFSLMGECQSCGHRIDIIINAFTDMEWTPTTAGASLYMQKIGQYPAYSIEVQTEVSKYLTEDDLSFYKKAMISLSQNYGIGAFAYFRRIIENEIQRLIKSISELEFDGVDIIKQAFLKYETDHQMSPMIDALNKHLPGSLTRLGDNPIKLLHQQLSEGIHGLTEEQCADKARHIDALLSYVIKVINEEKFAFKGAMQAIQALRKS